MRVPTSSPWTSVVVGLSVALSALSGCASQSPTVVALLVADGAETRPQAVDVEAFETRVRQRCGECEVVVHDAGGEAGEQAAQLDEALAEGAEVLVIEPVDPAGTAVIEGDDVPVVSLVTLVDGSDSFVGVAEAHEAGDASDLEAARAVILGERRTLEYVPATPMSEQAADVALGHLVSREPPGAVDQDGVSSWLYEVTDVGLADLTSMLVGSGAVSLEELCRGETAKRCRALGLR